MNIGTNNIESKKQILSRFLSKNKNDDREYLKSILHYEGYLYASDGVIAVRIPFAEGCEEITYIEHAKGKVMHDMFHWRYNAHAEIGGI